MGGMERGLSFCGSFGSPFLKRALALACLRDAGGSLFSAKALVQGAAIALSALAHRTLSCLPQCSRCQRPCSSSCVWLVALLYEASLVALQCRLGRKRRTGSQGRSGQCRFEYKSSYEVANASTISCLPACSCPSQWTVLVRRGCLLLSWIADKSRMPRKVRKIFPMPSAS
eukprot:4560803-Pyramimonas_sp.AAC.2